MKRFTLLALLLILLLAACEGDGPTAPTAALDTTFRGTFTPTAVAANGVCSLELAALPSGGVPAYACRWTMAWVNQASSARGYPNECTVNVSLPAAFGPGLFGMELEVTDARGDLTRAGTDENFDCSAATQTTFLGS